VSLDGQNALKSADFNVRFRNFLEQSAKFSCCATVLLSIPHRPPPSAMKSQNSPLSDLPKCLKWHVALNQTSDNIDGAQLIVQSLGTFVRILMFPELLSRNL